MNKNEIKHDKSMRHAKSSSQIMYFHFVRVFSSLGEIEFKKIFILFYFIYTIF